MDIEPDMERFLFSKIPMWLALLILVSGAVCVTGFGYVVQYVVKGGQGAGAIGDIAMAIANFPTTAKSALSGNSNKHLNDEHRFSDRKPGFEIIRSTGDKNYILMSRYDSAIAYNVVELVSEERKNILHKWILKDHKQFKFHEKVRFSIKPTANPATIRPMHPLLIASGELVLHFQHSPLYKLDQCGAVIWTNHDYTYHHSLEADADGNYWSPGTSHSIGNRFPGQGFDNRTRDDHIVQLSPSGKVIYSKSVLEIMYENDLDNRLLNFDEYQTDLIHLNDVQPALSDGPYWKKGDVFMSLGHMNMLMLYRPTSGKLVWMMDKYIMHQHDIDIVDQETVSVFQNRRTSRSRGNAVFSSNEILLITLGRDEAGNVGTKAVASPYKELMEKLDIRTVSQGIADFGADGSVLIEETNYGRLIKLDPSGEVEWIYTNKEGDDPAYTMNWVRYLSAEFGENVQAKLSENACPN